MRERKSQKQSNQEWLDSLTGKNGQEVQSQMYQVLSRYLYVVAINILKRQAPHLTRLNGLDDEVLECFAQEFVQDVLLKLTADKCSLLAQFKGNGKFTSWVAQIIHNAIMSELRKPSWHRVQPMDDSHSSQADVNPSPSAESIVMRISVCEMLNELMAKLPNRTRTALIRCVIHKERAAVVAADMGITANAVYVLVHRAKAKLREQLLQADYI